MYLVPKDDLLILVTIFRPIDIVCVRFYRVTRYVSLWYRSSPVDTSTPDTIVSDDLY